MASVARKKIVLRICRVRYEKLSGVVSDAMLRLSTCANARFVKSSGNQRSAQGVADASLLAGHTR